MADDLKRAVVWKNLLLNGMDYCALWHTTEGWLLKGSVVGILEDHSAGELRSSLRREVAHLQSSSERTIGRDVKSLSLTVESRRVWRSSGRELRDLHDCKDVDLALTPATNTLPIRRFNLRVGGTASVIAAWVKLPDLTVQPLPQTYTRQTENSYRYESHTGFSAEIAVDDFGLVIAYPGGWERVATL